MFRTAKDSTDVWSPPIPGSRVLCEGCWCHDMALYHWSDSDIFSARSLPHTFLFHVKLCLSGFYCPVESFEPVK